MRVSALTCAFRRLALIDRWAVRRPLPIAAVLVGVLLWPGVLAMGQAQPADLVTPTERTFLERLALARARGGLYGQIEQLPLRPDLSVGDWLADDVGNRRELRLWSRTLPGYGPPRVYSDGSCDAEVRVLPDELAKELIGLRGSRPPESDHPLSNADIRRAAEKWPILWSTGSSTLGDKVRNRKPVGWQDISFEGIQLARRAAAADAVHALIDQIGQLKVIATDSTRDGRSMPTRQLREFIESNDEVRAVVYDAVRDAATVTVEEAPDQVAVAQARLNMTDLIRILTDACQTHYGGDAFQAADFRELALRTGLSDLRATGLALPPGRYRQHEPYELVELDMPPWAGTTLRATGRYVPLDDEELPHATQVELARLDGMNELRKKVEKLVVKDDVTVERLLGYRRALKDDVVIFLSGTRVAGPPHGESDGTLNVPVELPLRRLWLIVRRGMERVEVDPPDEKPESPPRTNEVTP
jgi:uncharacterized protein (DUF934 family)